MRLPTRVLVPAAVISLALAGCSSAPATGALQVVVNLGPGLTSRCVKVVASDATTAKETKGITLESRTEPLRVAVYGDGLVQPVTVQAVGYADTGCTMPSGETSEQAEGRFTNPVSTVTVTLERQASNDGGFNPDGGGTDGGGTDGGGVDGGTDAGSDAGTDAGLDAGVDLDGDGFPAGADCNDSNAAIFPGAQELCTDVTDNDCDGLIDCMDPSCDGFVCFGANVCTNGMCPQQPELLCGDRVDNDGDTLTDCADPDCATRACDDGNGCTTGDVCATDGGGCVKTGDFACTNPSPGPCVAGTGTCSSVDGGAVCTYAQLSGACDDGLACTSGTTCSNGACGGGSTTPCNASPGACFQVTGTCTEPSASCVYAPLPMGQGTCTDNNTCTVGDTCAGDGGCAGTAVTCTPNQCQTASGTCQADGGCIFTARTGVTCDAGVGMGAATCDSSGACNVTPTSLYPYTPSNFTDSQFSSTAAPNVTVSCNTTINTTGTPSVTSGACVSLPPFTLITPPGGEETVLFKTGNLTVNSGQTLTITGTRPVIFGVVGNLVIDGTVLSRNGANTSAACATGQGGNGNDSGTSTGWGGGGGGAFGTAGALGGTSGGAGAGSAGQANGTADLKPLRGGCSGGNGTSNGGAGGGAVQFSASGNVNVAGTINAPGRGGSGATANQGNSGGGGGSGGGILLEGAIVTISSGARITANGGGGGEGSGTASGNPGTDGQVALTAAAGGGGNSPNGGDGGDGAARNAATAQPGDPGSGNGDGAGGGGGGMGRIRINASGLCSVATSGLTISPAASFNGTTGCSQQ